MVAAVEADALVSAKGGRYQRSEITTIERKTFSVPKTVGLGIGVFFGVVLVLTAVALASY